MHNNVHCILPPPNASTSRGTATRAAEAAQEAAAEEGELLLGCI